MEVMQQKPIIQLIRERDRLRLIIAAIPESGAFDFSAVARARAKMLKPLWAKLAALDKQIWVRPKFWQPRKADARDKRIARQYKAEHTPSFA